MRKPVTFARPHQMKSYRELAERCRTMATSSHRPGPLLERALVFEELALALEPDDTTAREAAD
jgi:hypothetical protein